MDWQDIPWFLMAALSGAGLAIIVVAVIRDVFSPKR